ncbi:MAG: putative peroxidase-related enzyme [Urechidicola sp.]|jgi:uncharacterized peroxidase-related enzyme
MTRLPETPEPSELSETYADICRVLNKEQPVKLITSMSVRPDLAKATWGMMKNLMTEGQLPPSVKQLIMMVISTQADCKYCAFSHQDALKSMGIDEAVMKDCLNDPMSAEIPELHRHITQFAARSAKDPNLITDDDLNQLRDVGVSDDELIEIGVIVAFSKFLNTWADASGISDDIPTDGLMQVGS